MAALREAEAAAAHHEQTRQHERSALLQACAHPTLVRGSTRGCYPPW